MIKPAVFLPSILPSIPHTLIVTKLQVKKKLWFTSLVWFHLEWRQSCLWTKQQVWPHDFLVLGTASQPPLSATPISTHAIQIKQIELFQVYITITKRRRWPFKDFYRLRWNVDLSCLQESHFFTANEWHGTKGIYG